jgi:hypothetical protein
VRIREEIHLMNSAGILETLWQDVRYGLRQLAGDRGFTTVAVLTLGLGIGSVTVMYSVIHNVLLDPFPTPLEPDGRRNGARHGPADSVFRGGADPGRVPRLPGAEPGVRGRDRDEHRGDGAPHAGTSEPVERRLGHARMFAFLGVGPLLGRTFGRPTASRAPRPSRC